MGGPNIWWAGRPWGCNSTFQIDNHALGCFRTPNPPTIAVNQNQSNSINLRNFQLNPDGFLPIRVYFSETTKGGLHRGSCKPPLFGDSDKLIDFEGFVMDFGGFWSQNIKICRRKSRDVLFLKKKGPCQERTTPSSELVFTKIPNNQGVLTNIILFSGKVQEAKWRHKFSLPNANLLS